MSSRPEDADVQRHREPEADADASRRAHAFRRNEHERRDGQQGDVPAGHVRRKSSRERERPDEHADDFHRNEQDVDRLREAVRHEVDPVLHESVRARAGDDDGEEA